MGFPKHTIESMNANLPKDCKLKAIRFDGFYFRESGERLRMVLCICACGKETRKRIDHFVNGRSLSCGCLRKERAQKANTKYWPVNENIYNSWDAMMHRCYNPKHISYKHYGGRGVMVCEDWKNDYQKFLDWSLANGWQDGYQIDKDILGDGMLYSPGTCKWVSREDNGYAKRNTIRNFGAFKEDKLVYSFKDVREAMSVLGGRCCSYSLALSGKKKGYKGYKLKFL